MNNALGPLVRQVSLNSGLFGKKPSALEIYENGIILKYKSGDKTCLFEQVSHIKTFDYFVPNAMSYHFDIFTTSGEKFAAVAIPSIQQVDATALLKAHMRFQLKDDFPQNLMTSDFVLDDYVSWAKGKLIYKNRKGTEEYSADQIDQFTSKNDAYFFTLKASKQTIPVSTTFTPNPLTTLEVCKAIAELN